MYRRGFVLSLVLFQLLFAASAVRADERYIVVASTTSTENSGLFGHLLPQFTAASGIQVRIVAVGTGQAIRLARGGDADVLLVHHEPSEEAVVADGFGLRRHDLMYNDFVIVGPKADPAGIRGLASAPDALRRVAEARAPFVSRGDDSGTHKAEDRLWGLSGIDQKAASGTWYRELGSGMGATLNTAAGLAAYTLADRGTWIAFRNRQDLDLLVEGDARLFNQYGVILVDPAKHPHTRAVEGQSFVDWLIGPAGQKAIADYKLHGQQLFFPNAARAGGS
ncbi:MAG: substrate-binding domain-containing protein [Alphaproteobacteria bacterium]|jgi:tungstate transport system substrate-binding protein|nr:substrate-binding domain-containing protein [Alphaproteobacteria bacterium]MDP6814670.1 substrate-binding domain-containing protein [Alphaproteobacteria bacterium]